MRTSISVLWPFFPLVLAACDQARLDNPMDRTGSAYHPHRISTASLPERAGKTYPSDSLVAAPSVVLSATVEPRWIFHHWSGAGTGGTTSNPFLFSFSDTAAASVRAVFVPEWTQTDSVVVDDFDVPSYLGDQVLNTFGYAAWAYQGEIIPRGGYWVAWKGPNTTFTPDSATAASNPDWRPAIEPGAGPDGSPCLHVGWNVGGTGFAGFTTYFQDIAYPVDLNQVRTVEFDLKGAGTIAVGLNTEFNYRLGSYEIADTLVSASASWTHVSIPIASFQASATRSPTLRAAAPPRDQLLASVIGLNFQSQTTGAADLWIDRIVLRGAPGAVLFPSLLGNIGN